MAATLTTIDISEYQIDSKMDWPGLIAAGVTSVIIRLSHGHTQDTEAAAHIASAKKYNLPWHGYHFYQGSSGEVEYSANTAAQLGLPSTSYLFLDFEDSDIGGDWSAQFYDFRNSWLTKGWKVGLYTGDYNYTHKGFDDDELTADGVYRWIASYSYEPANYDTWQYTSTGGLGNYTSNLDHDYDRTGKLSYLAPAVTTDPFEPPAPIAGSMVGIGFDSSPVGGDRSYGYTTDGKNFYAAITPWGFIFRQRDADRMWPLLKPKIGTIQGAKGDTGAAATIAVGTVTTGAAGTSAAVTNVGTANAAKLNFTIPQGAKGDKGDPGTTENVTIVDRRTINSTPLWYIENYPQQSVTELKQWSVLGVKAADFPTGVAPSNQYCTVRTDVPWTDNSAGWPYQTIEIAGEALPVIFVRVGISDSDWSAVKPITF